MPAKRATKPARQKAPETAGAVGANALAGDPHDCREKVLECIRQQAGDQELDNAKIGDIGVDGFVLAGCINEKLGKNYTGADFPPSKRVLEVIKKVCGAAALTPG